MYFMGVGILYLGSHQIHLLPNVWCGHCKSLKEKADLGEKQSRLY